MHEYMTVCEQAARKGGQVLLDWQGRINPREKAPKDLVSEADFASQQAIYEIIHGTFPEHDFLGEEGDGGGGDVDLRVLRGRSDCEGHFNGNIPSVGAVYRNGSRVGARTKATGGRREGHRIASPR